MHEPVDRRRFLFLCAAAGASSAMSSAVRAATTGPDKLDLLIKGGDVLDPSQKLRGVRTSAFATASSRPCRRIFRPSARHGC